MFGGNTGYDVNSADPALLRAIGVPPGAVDRILAIRSRGPILRDDVNRIREIAGPTTANLVAGGNTIFTLRATGRVRLQDGKSLRYAAYGGGDRQVSQHGRPAPLSGSPVV